MCCHQHLSVVSVEFARVSEAVLALAGAEKAALAIRLERGRGDPSCPLLDRSGRCRVYAARPMICRSHGVPMVAGEPRVRDVCPLNFTDEPDLNAIDDDCVLDVENIDRILGVVDRLGGDNGGRVDLFDGLSVLLKRLPIPDA